MRNDESVKRDSEKRKIRRENEDDNIKKRRKELYALRHADARSNATTEENMTRRCKIATLQSKSRVKPFQSSDWKNAAFNYQPHFNYANEKIVQIGSMSKMC